MVSDEPVDTDGGDENGQKPSGGVSVRSEADQCTGENKWQQAGRFECLPQKVQRQDDVERNQDRLDAHSTEVDVPVEHRQGQRGEQAEEHGAVTALFAVDRADEQMERRHRCAADCSGDQPSSNSVRSGDGVEQRDQVDQRRFDAVIPLEEHWHSLAMQHTECLHVLECLVEVQARRQHSDMPEAGCGGDQRNGHEQDQFKPARNG